MLSWEIVERLVPHLAWPVATLLMFFVAVSIFGRKLVVIAESLSALRQLPDALGVISTRFNEGAVQMSGQTENLVRVLSELPDRLSNLAEQLNSVREQIESKSIRDDAEALDKLTPSSAAPTSEPQEGLTVEAMHSSAISKWTALQAMLELRFRRANIRPDLRRLGQAAYELTSKDIPNPISRKDAELIATLFSQYRRFVSGGHNKEDWLTPYVYESFIRGVEEATQVLNQNGGSGDLFTVQSASH